MRLQHPARPIALLAAGLLLATACQSADLSSPSVPTSSAAASGTPGGGHGLAASPNGNANAHAFDAHPSPAVCTPHDVVEVSGVFGPSGGTLVIGDDRLIIPGGALHDTVTITASRTGDSTSTVEFQPHGLHFYKPAGLVLDSDGCTIPPDGVPSVVYLGPTGEVLESIAAVYSPLWHTVAAPIEHFSGYAIAF
jgi:hypothetical protein